jgi:hypothetical protein
MELNVNVWSEDFWGNISYLFILLLDMNRCYYQSSICLNGGTCVPGSNGAYSCRCPSSYGGASCEQFLQTSSIDGDD